MGSDSDTFIAFILGLLGAVVVAGIINDAAKSKRYTCPNCRTVITTSSNICPECETPLRWG